MSRLLKLFLICNYLLSANLSVAQSNAHLLSAIKNNSLAEIKNLLERGSNISVVDDDSDNVLMYAALYSTADCMKLLLQKGANPNAKNKLGETAIMWCSHDLEKTKLLLEYKADVNNKTTDGNTPLLVACVGNGQYDMIKLLLDYGANPLLLNNKNSGSLMRIAIYGDTSSARLLLNKGVDINAKNNEKQPALHFAVKSGNKDMIYWLIENGADVNIKDNYNATILSYAVILNDIDIMNVILDKTKGINEQDIDGTTILMWAIYSEYDNAAIIQALIDKGAALNLKDKRGETALTWALKKGNTKTVALLKKAGAEQ